MIDRLKMAALHKGLIGGGEMGDAIRSFDWSSTPLGAIEHWSISWRTAVNIGLSSAFPVLMGWGKELILLYNDAAIPLLGCHHGQALGQPYPEHWDNWPLSRSLLEQVLITGQPTQSAGLRWWLNRHGDPHGALEEVYFSHSSSPIVDDDTSIGGVLTLLTETPERVRHQHHLPIPNSTSSATFAHDKKLRLSSLLHPVSGQSAAPSAEVAQTASDQIRNILESITDAFVAFDRQWRYLYVNRAAAQILQRPPEELLGKHVWEEVFPSLIGGSAYEKLHQVMNEQISIAWEAFELPLQCWLEVNAYPSSDGVVLYFRDITERKRAEQRQAIQYAISRILAEATTITAATPAILQALCETLGWSLGVIWKVDVAGQVLRHVNSWQSPAIDASALMTTHPQTTFPLGIGLPGQVWAQKQPVWISELREAQNFPRAVAASSSGFHTVLGFPIQLGEEILGVIECFSQHPLEPDEALLHLMAAIGHQVGQFIERIETEVSLHQREEALRLITNAVPALIAYVGADYRYRFVNEAFSTWFNRPVEQIIGQTVEAFVGEEIYSYIKPDIDTALSGQTATSELWMPFQSGGRRYVRRQYIPDRDSQGQVRGFYAFVNDITDLKQAQDCLQASEKQYRQIVETANEGIWAMDAQACTVYVNSHLTEMLGYRPEEMLGRSALEFVFEEDLLTVQAHLQQQPPDLKQQFECRLCCRSGSWVWVLLNTSPILDERNEYQGMLGMVIDISDRKQAEENRLLLSAIVESSQDAIIGFTLDGILLSWNTGAEKIFGYTEAEAKGQRASLIVPPARLQESIDIFAAMQRGESIANFETVRLRKDGSAIDVSITVSPIRNSQNQLVGVSATLRDITERKRTEVALRESEERLQLALTSTQTLVWDMHLPSQQVICSGNASEMWGMTSGSATDFFARVHPDDRDRMIQATAQALVDAAEYRQEYRIIDPSGQTRWLLSQGKVHQGADGQPERMVGVSLEITERKRSELQLRESEARLHIIQDQAPVGIVEKDLNGQLLRVNERFCEILGYKSEEVLGRTFQDLTHPDDVALNVEAFQRLQTGEIPYYHLEKRYLHKDGRAIWGELYVYLIRDVDDTPKFAVAIVQDITDRQQAAEALQQSEERYRYLAESIPQLIWTANAAGVLLDVNQRWSDFTGLTLEQAQLEGWGTVVHPEDVPMLSQAWAAAQYTGHYQAEGRMRRADGLYRWHLHQAVPSRNERGAIVKWFGTATDIEDQKQLEQQRDRILQQEQAARAEAEQANRIKDEFLAVLSHELRSPLNPILGWAQMLQTRSFDEQATKRALGIIERNAKLQTQLIDDLLDVSRILRGKMVLNIHPVDLKSVIEGALETVRLAAEAKGIQIQKTLDSQVGSVSGEPGRLQQVVWNLLSNAIKFTPEGGRIDIQLMAVGHMAHIQVKDTGKGIAPTFLPYVFEYFRQEDGKTTRRFGGLGLGLAIVRHLVELHGGTVQAASDGEGQGATFTVRLPLTIAKTAVSLAPTTCDRPIQLNQMRILVVDDEADMREFMQILLQQYNVTVRVAASAHEALERLQQSPPDLLISDIGMPDVDGYMLIRQIRALPADQGGAIPAIALTAYAGEQNQQHALNAGFQLHMPKPIDPDALVQAISQLLQSNCSSPSSYL